MIALSCALGAAIGAPGGAAAGEFQPASVPSDEGAPRVFTTTNAQQLFFTHERKLRFSYRVVHSEPVDVKAKLIRPKTGAVIRRWTTTVSDDSEQYLYFNGTIDDQLQEEHKYAFRLVASDPDGPATYSASENDRDRDSFKFWHNRFPVRGAHSYGDGIGAGRGHQGQDVFASSGTRLEAARGGRVQYAGYQSSAGYYLVIDARMSKRDYVYMHLERNILQTGDRVRTGQSIGQVSDSGNASGCHLHFEMWSKPGWYEGGSFMDPTPFLKYWDSYS